MSEVMTRIEDTFKLKGDVNNVVSFEQNPYLMGLNHYTELFNAIINKQVLKVVYRPNFKEAHAYIFHPYHLKQYNNRWFIFGLSTTDGYSQIMNMSIDRIESFEICNACYIENSNIDFDAYFEDRKVRTVWDEEQEKWYFSVVDVIEVLTASVILRIT